MKHKKNEQLFQNVLQTDILLLMLFLEIKNYKNPIARCIL